MGQKESSCLDQGESKPHHGRIFEQSAGNELSGCVTSELLGTGSFGEVYRAKRLRDGVEVAVKLVEKERMMVDYLVNDLYNELNILSRTRHSNIIHLDDYVVDFVVPTTGKHYTVLVMEYAPLCIHSLTEGTPQLLSSLMRGVVCGLAYLHHNQVVHRDLKPENLLLLGDEVKIIDFGCAALLDSSDEEALHSFCGTEPFIAPEVGRAEGYGTPVDIYALGRLYEELITRWNLPSPTGDAKLLLDRCVHTEPLLRPTAVELCRHFAVDSRHWKLPLVQPKRQPPTLEELYAFAGWPLYKLEIARRSRRWITRDLYDKRISQRDLGHLFAIYEQPLRALFDGCTEKTDVESVLADSIANVTRSTGEEEDVPIVTVEEEKKKQKRERPDEHANDAESEAGREAKKRKVEEEEKKTTAPKQGGRSNRSGTGWVKAEEVRLDNGERRFKCGFPGCSFPNLYRDRDSLRKTHYKQAHPNPSINTKF